MLLVVAAISFKFYRKFYCKFHCTCDRSLIGVIAPIAAAVSVARIVVSTAEDKSKNKHRRDASDDDASN